MNKLVETDRLFITEMTADMAMDVHKNSLDEDIRRFVPDEVFETPEEAEETVEFLMSQYGTADGPLVYAVLLKDGEKNEDFNFNNYNYPRTVIGMVKPGEYYVLVSNNQGYDGPTYRELQDIFIDLDCEFAACLDGGGSSQLIFNDKLINKTAQNKERAVVDFIYFTDEVSKGLNNEKVI